MHSLQIKPKQVVKRLIKVLPERACDVVVNRYGLGKDPKKMTLESIGKKYGITRERVRQIENYAIMSIKKSDAFSKEQASFNELRDFFHKLGGILAEDDFLKNAAKDKSTQNHVHFMLVLGDAFKKEKEDEHFRHRWNVDEKLSL